MAKAAPGAPKEAPDDPKAVKEAGSENRPTRPTKKKPEKKPGYKPSEARRMAAQKADRKPEEKPKKMLKSSLAVSADHLELKVGMEVFVESENQGKACLFARRIEMISANGTQVGFAEAQDQPVSAPPAECYVDLSIAWKVTRIRRVES